MGRSATLFSKLTCSKKPSESIEQRADKQTISNGASWSFTRETSQSSYRIPRSRRRGRLNTINGGQRDSPSWNLLAAPLIALPFRGRSAAPHNLVRHQL